MAITFIVLFRASDGLDTCPHCQRTGCPTASAPPPPAPIRRRSPPSRLSTLRVRGVLFFSYTRFFSLMLYHVVHVDCISEEEFLGDTQYRRDKHVGTHLPPTFRPAGTLYFFSSETFILRAEHAVTIAVIIPASRSHDRDTLPASSTSSIPHNFCTSSSSSHAPPFPPATVDVACVWCTVLFAFLRFLLELYHVVHHGCIS